MPIFNQVLQNDATRTKRPTLPIEYKTKPGETVIYKRVKGLNRPAGVVRSKQESVSVDTRSNYQKKVDTQRAQQVRQRYEQNKAEQEGLQTLAALGKAISPSTYFGAAGRALAGDGKLTGNILDGSGFGDTTANVAFDLAFPFAAKTGINNGKIFLQNTAPGIFDPYTTFRGSLGYYGNSLTDRILGTYGRRFHLPVKNQMPELFRSDRFRTIEGIFDNPDAAQGRFPWQNLTTDTFVRDHSRGHWSGNDIVIKNPSMYDPSGYLSTQPSDTFILKGFGSGINNPKNYTLVSGNIDLLQKAKAAGIETLSTPKLRDAYSRLQDRISASMDGVDLTRPIQLGKLFRPERSDEGRNYSSIIRKLLHKRGQPNYDDYVYQSEQTGLPITVSRTPFTVPHTKLENVIGNPNLVFYDRATPFESYLRGSLNIPSSGISLETRMLNNMDNSMLRNEALNLNNLFYKKH